MASHKFSDQAFEELGFRWSRTSVEVCGTISFAETKHQPNTRLQRGREPREPKLHSFVVRLHVYSAGGITFIMYSESYL